MFSLTVFNVRFTPRWWMCLLALFFIVLFMRLGFWQLHRADEKKQMLSAHQLLAKLASVEWMPGNKLPTQYQQIKVAGQFLPMVLLFDNQHYQHQFGYHAISPLLLSNGEVILIDRGWLAGDVTRQALPAVTIVTGSIQLHGGAYYPSEKNWLLGQLIEKKKRDLVIVERLDTQLIGQFLHKSVYPFIIRLGKHEAGGYIREWAIVSMPPERHYGYALQWFAMALVILILFVVLNSKKKT